jgi:hypothetical protein
MKTGLLCVLCGGRMKTCQHDDTTPHYALDVCQCLVNVCNKTLTVTCASTLMSLRSHDLNPMIFPTGSCQEAKRS